MNEEFVCKQFTIALYLVFINRLIPVCVLLCVNYIYDVCTCVFVSAYKMLPLFPLQEGHFN